MKRPKVARGDTSAGENRFRRAPTKSPADVKLNTVACSSFFSPRFHPKLKEGREEAKCEEPEGSLKNKAFCLRSTMPHNASVPGGELFPKKTERFKQPWPTPCSPPLRSSSSICLPPSFTPTPPLHLPLCPPRSPPVLPHLFALLSSPSPSSPSSASSLIDNKPVKCGAKRVEQREPLFSA
ncbi:unnamed protein product [Pleuronectes platessa]|uniref:Uncharacterized protein n=1 Tax=Pleuronectes platessa TaxID=8262 RepID=A0A9N7YPD6_PLEPL|nr:unnamed protein product [Pleuronectes platessa]